MNTDKLTLEYVDIDKVIPYVRNPRKNDNAVSEVAASIREFGFKQGIVVDEQMTIVVGHTRWQAAKKLGYKQVPIHIAKGLTEQQIKAYRIADNKTNESAEWDIDLLKLELEETGELYTGWSSEEIDGLYSDEQGRNNGNTDPDEVPEVPTTPVSQMGDVWILGDHKVIMGSSTDPETYKALLDTEVIDMIWTDPPYTVNYEPPSQRMYGGGLHVNKPKTTHIKIQNDNMDSNTFKAFLDDAFGSANNHLKKGGVFYISFSDIEGLNFRQAVVDAGWLLKQTITWVKNGFVFGRQDYHWKSEPILYGWKEGAGHYFIDEYNHSTVQDFREDLDKKTKEELVAFIKGIPVDIIDCDKPTAADLHPTMKPVKLITFMVRNSSKQGELVMDMFGGSGSTLIACETLKRKARLIELEGKYVDVIVNRWQDFTGNTATLQGTDQTFEQIRQQRLNP